MLTKKVVGITQDYEMSSDQKKKAEDGEDKNDGWTDVDMVEGALPSEKYINRIFNKLNFNPKKYAKFHPSKTFKNRGQTKMDKYGKVSNNEHDIYILDGKRRKDFKHVIQNKREPVIYLHRYDDATGKYVKVKMAHN